MNKYSVPYITYYRPVRYACGPSGRVNGLRGIYGWFDSKIRFERKKRFAGP